MATQLGGYRDRLAAKGTALTEVTTTQGGDKGFIDTTPYHADGTAGILISGVQWVTGKSGIDSATNVLEVIEYEHHEIHSGSFYRIHINKDVANAGTFNVCFTTPNNTKWAHMIFAVDVEGQAQSELIESVTGTPTTFSGGTALTPRNADRNSANTSGITNMVYDATITRGTPIVLDIRVLGSGKSQGGEARSLNEWVLKQNTVYCFTVTNQALGATNEVNLDLEWYEHINK